MIANRVNTSTEEDIINVFYYLDDALVMTLSSNYGDTILVSSHSKYLFIGDISDSLPYLLNPKVSYTKSPVDNTLKVVIPKEDNFFEGDFTKFNKLVLGLDNTKDFIF